VIVPDAGHYIQVDEPQAVVNAIKTVVEQTRNSSK
jgi:pimeloyl-ACP methyl ester carboxylesterase